jgi:hypothetical protein
MKLNSILSAGLFAAIAALSMGAQAASDTDKAAEAKAPAAGVQADKKVKPHSHMEEKTGMPQKVADSKVDKPDPTKDKKALASPGRQVSLIIARPLFGASAFSR